MTRRATGNRANGIHRRLTTIVAGLGGPATTANRTGLARQTIRYWLDGRSLPSAPALIILNQVGIAPDWLLFGEGKPPKLPYPQPKLATKGKR